MRNELRRVVVTGVGIVSPLGVGVRHTWPRLLGGHSGVKPTVSLSDPAFTTLPSRIAGIVPRGASEDGGWDAREHLSKTEERNLALFSQYAIVAAEEALNDSDVLSSLSEEDKEATAVVVGSGIGNLEDQHNTSVAFDKHGHHRMHPLYVPRLLINMAAGHIAMRYGFKGPNLAPTTACTTGLHAIIEGAQLIRNPGMNISTMHDTVDIVVAGASEACIHPLAISGFARARSLSTNYNDVPQQASRPFDKGRDGFVIGEGAGIVVLEERERAIKRRAHIYRELVGSGMSCDASHMTAPSSNGRGAQLAMERALCGLVQRNRNDEAWQGPEDAWQKALGQVDYINAHATGTSLGDSAENRAIRQLFAEVLQTSRGPAVGSTKGATGHLLGGAGAVEAIFTLLSIRSGGIPPTLNLVAPGPAERGEAAEAEAEEQGIRDGWSLDYVTTLRGERPKIALTNSFGFGGTNASVAFTS